MSSSFPAQPVGRDRRLIGFAVAWAVFCLAADYLTGPGVEFGSLYAIPVVVAAWYAHLGLALSFALVLPIAEFFLDMSWGSFGVDPGDELFRSFVRVVALVTVALLVDRFSRTRSGAVAERRVELPPDVQCCEVCGNVQDAGGNWWTLDPRLHLTEPARRAGVRCPTCAAAAPPSETPSAASRT